MNRTKLNLIVLLCFSFIILSSCNKENQQNKDQEKLEQLYIKIKNLAESSTCGGTTNYELKFTPAGSRACGGPSAHLAYSSSINVDEFEDLVKKYTTMQADYNKKWNIVSPCDIIIAPSGVKCENGKPVLVYATYK